MLETCKVLQSLERFIGEKYYLIRLDSFMFKRGEDVTEIRAVVFTSGESPDAPALSQARCTTA